MEIKINSLSKKLPIGDLLSSFWVLQNADSYSDIEGSQA